MGKSSSSSDKLNEKLTENQTSTSKINFRSCNLSSCTNPCKPENTFCIKITKFYNYWNEFIILTLALLSIVLGVFFLAKVIIDHQASMFMIELENGEIDYPDGREQPTSYGASLSGGFICIFVITIGILMTCWFRARLAFEWRNHDKESATLDFKPRIGMTACLGRIV